MTVKQTAYGNIDVGKCFSTGNSFRVTIAATIGQGNDGTSLPCALVWITLPSANTGPVKMNFDAAASATLGIELYEGVINGPFNIDDLSKLHFYSATNGDIIDLAYLK